MRSWKDENRVIQEEEDDDKLMDPDMEGMEEADWQSWARDHPNAAIPVFTVDDLGRRLLDIGWDIHASHTQWNDIDKMASYLNEQKCDKGIEDDRLELVDIGWLTPEQRVIFDTFVNTYRSIIADEEVQQQLLNVDGTAGCGKT